MNERNPHWTLKQSLSMLLKRASDLPQSFVVAFVLFTEALLFNSLREIAFLSSRSDRIILVFLTGFLFLLTYLWESSTARLPYRQAAAPALFAFLALVFWYWTTCKHDLYLHFQIPLVLSTLLLFGNSIHEDDRKIWDWQNSLCRTLIEAGMVALAFVASLFLIIYLIEFLFDIRIPRAVHEVISKTGATIVPSVTFLIRIPIDRTRLTKFGEGMIRFFILPLWLVCIFLLNIYALKILIHWSLPKGMVSMPVCITFVVYIMAWWGSLQIRTSSELRWPTEKTARITRLMHVPLLVLMAVSVGRRIADYGITQPRYFLILLWVFFAGFVVLDLTRRLSGKRVAGVLVTASLLSLIWVAGN